MPILSKSCSDWHYHIILFFCVIWCDISQKQFDQDNILPGGYSRAQSLCLFPFLFIFSPSVMSYNRMTLKMYANPAQIYTLTLDLFLNCGLHYPTAYSHFMKLSRSELLFCHKPAPWTFFPNAVNGNSTPAPLRCIDRPPHIKTSTKTCWLHLWFSPLYQHLLVQVSIMFNQGFYRAK